MNVLCTDKTGTLTENQIKLILYVDMEGNDDEKVLLYSFLNSHFQTGLRSPLDEAILKFREIDASKFQKIDEVSFDFVLSLLSFCLAHAVTLSNQTDVVQYKEHVQQLYVGFEFYVPAKTYNA